MKEQASADGRSKIADRLQLESSRNPLPTFVNVNEPAPPSPICHLPSSRKRGHAFSLVELLAVVGIVAILSVAAVPVMRGLGGSQSSRATASILVSALEQARTAAILSGTNAYLALPDAGTTTMNATNRLRTYAVIRQIVDQDANGLDDYQTNVATSSGWVLLSKWERLPGDLQFSANSLVALTNRITPTGVAFPGNVSASAMPAIGFAPSGGLSDGTGTNGLLFASSAKVTNGRATVADRIDISFYSGRVRYTGIVTNTNF
jgi:prepilin-type N-terminal cleavage/methylation domain-containing protein